MRQACLGDTAAAAALTAAAEATAHGRAILLVDGEYGQVRTPSGPRRRRGRATLALIAGRASLRPEQNEECR